MQQAGVGACGAVWMAMAMAAAGLTAAGCASHAGKAECQAVPAGCEKPFLVLAPGVTPQMLATPSSEVVDQSGASAGIRERNWPAMTSYYAPQVVQHAPLYFEDEMENVGTLDPACPLGYTWLDPLSIPYSDARWMLNTIALPVSLVAYPPWQKQCSDGVPGKTPLGLTLDARSCAQPVPTPFDLKCPQEQAQTLAQLTGGPIPTTGTVEVPTSRPAE